MLAEWVYLYPKTDRLMRLIVQGQLSKISVRSTIVPPPSKRGRKVEGFSKKSRKRLIEKVLTMDLDKMPKPVFLTLTYPSVYPSDDDARKHLRTLWKRVVRATDNSACALWRMELQKRGAPHFHLIMWLPKRMSKEWYAQNWFGVVGSGDDKHLKAGTRIEHIRTRNGLVWYVSKYVAKVEQGATTGRVWGVMGQRNIIYHEKVELTLTPAQFEQLKDEYERRVQKLRADVHGFSLYNADLFDIFLDSTPNP